MKTLDEVIKALEMCTTCPEDDEMCPGCPYADEQGNPQCVGQDKDDALHYLKEFKRISARLEKIALGNITETLEKLDNPALTWDELKQMAGKPVWVEALLYKQWAVIAYVGDEYIRFEGADLYAPECRTYMGDDGWQAYRKERE